MGDGQNGSFGAFVKRKRIGNGVTLRQFCRQHGYDAGNMSKIERGLLPPPRKREELERHAKALGLQRGSDDWLMFFDLAAVAAGRIPDRIMSDEALVAQLPLVFRTISGQRLSAGKLRDLAETIRKG